MSIHKKLLKTYETLYKFNKNNKFSQKKNKSFIHLYFLYLQNKYRFNFDFKNYPKNEFLYQMLNDLYSGVPTRKSKNLLFPNDKLLGDIFFVKDDFDIEKFLTKLEEYTYNLNYVNTNIQLVDFLGNTENDVTVTKIGLCLLVFKEQFPLIRVNTRLTRNITNHLVRTAQPRNNMCTYINSISVFILSRLKRLHKFTNYPEYIKLLISTSDSNGIWNSGYNGYLVENSIELDILHTCIAMINLLDYQINNKLIEMNQNKDLEKKEINSDTENELATVSENEESENENEESESKLVEDENKLDELTEAFTSFLEHKKKKREKNKTKEIIERFDNLSEVTGSKFYFDLNFYNTTLILVLVLVSIVIYRYKLKV